MRHLLWTREFITKITSLSCGLLCGSTRMQNLFWLVRFKGKECVFIGLCCFCCCVVCFVCFVLFCLFFCFFVFWFFVCFFFFFLCSYDPVFQAIRLATKFVFETLCRAKQKHHLQQWMLELTEMYRRHIPACHWFLDRITRSSTWVECIFFYCPSKSVREILADFIISVMEIISAQPSEPPSYVDMGDAELRRRDADLAPVDTSKVSIKHFGVLPFYFILFVFFF